MNVAVRADGGPEIGYGHLVRSGALARELLDRGHEVTYFTTTADHVSEVCPRGVETLELSSRADAGEAESALAGRGVDVFHVDSYVVDAAYQRRIGETVGVVSVQVDDAEEAVAADLVVNGNLYADDLTYEWVGDEPEWCLGPEYAPLRRSIRELADRDHPVPDEPDSAVLTMGGSDIAGTTPTALRGFDDVGLNVDVVVGPGFNNEAEIRRVAKSIDATVTLHRDPADVAELLFDADLAVSGCGSTVYELLALGTPFVCAVQATNQRPIARALSDRGLAIVLNESPREKDFGAAVRRLAGDLDRRRNLRDRGQAVVDGNGVIRISDRMELLLR